MELFLRFQSPSTADVRNSLEVNARMIKSTMIQSVPQDITIITTSQRQAGLMRSVLITDMRISIYRFRNLLMLTRNCANFLRPTLHSHSECLSATVMKGSSNVTDLTDPVLKVLHVFTIFLSKTTYCTISVIQGLFLSWIQDSYGMHST